MLLQLKYKMFASSAWGHAQSSQSNFNKRMHQCQEPVAANEAHAIHLFW